MADYIERQAALHAVNEFFHDPKVDIALNAVPAANVREDVQGEWKRVGFEKGFECSNCGSRCLLNYESDFYPSKFCPHCGARMVGGENK